MGHATRYAGEAIVKRDSLHAQHAAQAFPPEVPGEPRSGLLASLVAVFVSSLISVTLTVSLAALVYSGELAVYRAEAMGLALLGGSVLGLFVAVRSSLPGMVATAQDATAAVLAVAAASTIASFPADLNGAALFSTVTVAHGATALFAAVALFAFGRFGIGAWVRYLPHPVVGGFLAGTGWLLLLGSIAVMSGGSLGASALTTLLQPEAWLRIAPGLALAAVLWVLTRGAGRVWVWPGVLLGSVALFYLTMAAVGATPSAWRELGLLLGPFPEVEPLRAFAALDLGAVHWPSVARYAPTAVAVSLLAAIGILLNTTALELVTDRRIDLDRELRTAGTANLLTAAVGGLVGYHVLADTALMHSIGRGTRGEAVGVAASTGLAFLAGAAFLAFFPTALLGGLLAYLGFTFMHEWLITAFGKLGPLEYAIVVLILVSIAILGFLPGLVVGIGAALVLFVVDYSRTEVVKHELTGGAYRSRVSRSATQNAVLVEHGDAIRIYELQGYLFFGTASGLLDRIEAGAGDGRGVEIIVLDFRQTTGVDATALVVLDKLVRFAERRGFRVVLSAATPRIARQVEARRQTTVHDQPVRLFESLDEALEWCEERVLDAYGIDRAQSGFEDWLAEQWKGPGSATDFLAYFESASFDAGGVLIQQGDAPDTLYVVATGAVTAQVMSAAGSPVRLETMDGGNLVGELGFFTGSARTASVVADEPTVAYRLTAAAHIRMNREAPDVAAGFHALVVRILAERTKHLMRVVDALQR